MRLEAVEELAIAQLLGAPVIHDDDIETTEHGLMPAKRVAYYPFQTVPCYRPAAILLGDGQAEARPAERVRAVENGERAIPAAPGAGEDPIEGRLVR